MRLPIATTAICILGIISTVMASNERKVFAHYMLGLTDGQTSSDWALDMITAKAAGIDGFALNAGPNDSFGDKQLELAYRTAEEVGFAVFVSFDMGCCGPWDINKVINWTNTYKGSSAQYKVNNLPFISTFEGPAWADNWTTVRAQTGGIYLVPDWTSLGPNGIAERLGMVDGAFSWDAWSNTPGPKTTDTDQAYRRVLGNKSYMMGVSPFFYTNIPDYNKNWYWGPDTLWFDRWEQVLDIMPDLVEIISWNDYSESHYIGTQRPSSIIPPAKPYTLGIPHDGLRMILPYYILSYKSGKRVDIPPNNEGAVFWYRTAPRSSGTSNTPYGPAGTIPAINTITDTLYITTLSNSSNRVFVSIGGTGQYYEVQPGVGMMKVPFDGRVGQVMVEMGGKRGVGSKDVGSGSGDGEFNFNPVVGWTGGMGGMRGR